jgi:hypothetical protein
MSRGGRLLLSWGLFVGHPEEEAMRDGEPVRIDVAVEDAHGRTAAQTWEGVTDTWYMSYRPDCTHDELSPP